MVIAADAIKMVKGGPWPERHDFVCYVVDTEGAEHEYPVAGLGKQEVIVYIPFDPLNGHRTMRLANGNRWTCVLAKADIA